MCRHYAGALAGASKANAGKAQRDLPRHSLCLNKIPTTEKKFLFAAFAGRNFDSIRRQEVEVGRGAQAGICLDSTFFAEIPVRI